MKKLMLGFTKKNIILLIAVFIVMVILSVIFILQRDIVVAEIDGVRIYQSEIDFVLEDMKPFQPEDTKSLNDHRRDILETGIIEIITVNEGERMGISIDESVIDTLIKMLETEHPDIYKKIIERFGLEKYRNDLEKRQIFNAVREKVIHDAELFISDEELYLWSKEYYADMDLDSKTFIENIDLIKSNWYSLAEDKIFFDWVEQKRLEHTIVIYRKY